MDLKRREATAAILFAQDGRLLLQQRDNIPGILHPGKVGLFGGHREGNEAFLDCIVREIFEEIGCRLPASSFQHLASRLGPDPDVPGGVVHGEIFVARNIPIDRLIVCEGTLLVMRPSAISEIAHKLVPSAHFALECFGYRL
ncbi:NUDIX domain-containing protein [Bradyrhizobium nanningense]|uniref:NUDIX domain-containing protein n=1 Tax=Bradyrhizobium nanningense TaxID=1325118 RepID=UPI00100915FB|nr:NUDIX domain-containing protein [Bradyrhizobium nanningense]